MKKPQFVTDLCDSGKDVLSTIQDSLNAYTGTVLVMTGVQLAVLATLAYGAITQFS